MTVLLAALLAVIAPTTAVAIDLPSESSPAAAPAPVPASVAAPALAAPVTTAPTTLRIGARGVVVRDLQRELRRRGYRYVRVDGAYGPATRRAVKALQRRLRMRATGVADPRLLKRLGIQSTGVASAPVASVGATLGARYLRAFPVLGEHDYIDSFGAGRHQGAHQGNDIMADRGTPVVAVADGVIMRLTRVETGLGGIWIWLRDTQGNEYYYAHMSAIAEGLNAGSRVAVGQVIGAVGNTGDARATLPHLHFEIHPGGGGAVDPYAELRSVDPDARTTR